ncbi:MAG: hypothetical protein SGCHY_003948 [Lobulomycetales sp.]
MADDWDTVTVLRKKTPTGAAAKGKAAVNAAMRSGNVTTTSKGVSNSKAVYDARKMGKIENETEDFKIEKVSLSVSKAISKARAEKGLSQKDLATKVNEKQQVVNDFEAGRAVPNQQVLGKLERALGVKLRGKDIGAPLAPRGGKK